MYLPKVLNNALVTEVKKFFNGLNYKWSILKGNVEVSSEVETKWLKVKWHDTMKLGLDFLKPVKLSELVAPIIGYIYSAYPEYEKEFKEILKEADKRIFITKGLVENFKQQIINHKFEIEYSNKELIISETYNDNYFQLIVNEELLCEILKIAAEDKGNREPLQDFVFSILPTSMQNIISKRLMEDYQEIREYRISEAIEEILDGKENIEVDNDWDSKNTTFIIKVNHEKKYKIEIINKHKALISINGQVDFVAKTMTDIEEFLHTLIEE